MSKIENSTPTLTFKFPTLRVDWQAVVQNPYMTTDFIQFLSRDLDLSSQALDGVNKALASDQRPTFPDYNRNPYIERKLTDKIFLPALAQHDDVKAVVRLTSDNNTGAYDRVAVIPEDISVLGSSFEKWTRKILLETERTILPSGDKFLIAHKGIKTSWGFSSKFKQGQSVSHGQITSGDYDTILHGGVNRNRQKFTKEQREKLDAELLSFEKAAEVMPEGAFAFAHQPNGAVRIFYPTNLNVAALSLYGSDKLPGTVEGYVPRSTGVVSVKTYG